MFGVTREGNSILAHINGFEPYFFMQAPNNLNLELEGLRNFTKELNKVLSGVKVFRQMEPIERIVGCRKEGLRYYKGPDSKVDFLQVFCKQPAYVSSIRGWLRGGRCIEKIDLSDQTFESNMPFALRFMIDRDIVGMGWVRLEQYKIREKEKMTSRCQIEVDVEYR